MTVNSPSGEEDRLPCFTCKKEEIVVTIKRLVIGIARIANTSRKINVQWERNVHSSIHQRRIDLPVQKEKQRKSGWTREGNGCNCEYCKSPSEDYFRKALAIGNFQELSLKS